MHVRLAQFHTNVTVLLVCAAVNTENHSLQWYTNHHQSSKEQPYVVLPMYGLVLAILYFLLFCVYVSFVLDFNNNNNNNLYYLSMVISMTLS